MASQLSAGVIVKLQEFLDAEVAKEVTLSQQTARRMLARQLKIRGFVVDPNEKRDGFTPEVWTLLDELDRSRVEQMRLKTELAAAKEDLKKSPALRVLEPAVPRRQGILKDPKAKPKPKDKPKPPKRFVLYECGICNHLHSWTFKGDCRADTERYAGIEDYCRRTSVDARDVDVKTWAERVADEIPF